MSNIRYPERPILILDDDPGMRARVTLLLEEEGYGNVVATDDSGYAARLIATGKVELILLDLHLPPVSGEVLLRDFTHQAPQIPIIIITGNQDPTTIVRCMKAGAIDYLVKPIEAERLISGVRNGLNHLEISRAAMGFRDKVFAGGLEKPELFKDIVSADPRMLVLFKYVEAVAKSRQPVLIIGETGTGKELIAKAVHEASGRPGPFVALNIAGLDDTILSDTLFGHRKGAYTGAEGSRAGLIKEAAGGSLFLDEIGDLEQRSQIKLLRLLQEGEYYPLGADSPQRSETRIIAATTKDLKAATKAGSFRADLFYRLQTHLIHIPPLRERRGDIGLLVDHFMALSAKALGREKPRLAPGCVEALGTQDFPGNVRELESLVHDAMARVPEEDEAAVLWVGQGRGPGQGPEEGEEGGKPEGNPGGFPLALTGREVPTLKATEEWLIQKALQRAGGNIQKASRILGVSRQTLYKHLGQTEGPGEN